jgi:hypothetical protein
MLIAYIWNAGNKIKYFLFEKGNAHTRDKLRIVAELLKNLWTGRFKGTDTGC